MKLIRARAFVASLTLSFSLDALDVDAAAVGIFGHSRNGKQSLIAAAFDERFTGVIGSSPGAPITSPYQLSSHDYYGEGPDAQTPNWWLDRIKDFSADPTKLGIDGHAVLALVAPRALQIAHATTDHEGDLIFSDEYAALAAREAYSLLGAAPETLEFAKRPGDHHGFNDVQAYFDFFQRAKEHTISSDPVLSPAGFDWAAWNASQAPAAPPAASAAVDDRVRWLLQHDAASKSRREPVPADFCGVGIPVFYRHHNVRTNTRRSFAGTTPRSGRRRRAPRGRRTRRRRASRTSA